MCDSSKKVLLLADDDGDDRELFCEAISTIDPNVLTYCTENGKELLEKLTYLTELPHLIFLDINMPVMDGWECLRLLKADQLYTKIPIIMFSTSSMKRDIDKALNMGATCFFIKPSDFTDLNYVLTLFVDNANIDLCNVISKLNDQQKNFLICQNYTS